jgi:hypothetical protein
MVNINAFHLIVIHEPKILYRRCRLAAIHPLFHQLTYTCNFVQIRTIVIFEMYLGKLEKYRGMYYSSS